MQSPLKMVPHTAAKHLLLKKYLDRWFPLYFQGFDVCYEARPSSLSAVA
jgi:hypothetical protein